MVFLSMHGAHAQDATATLEELLRDVREQGTQSSQESQAREAEFRKNRDRQKLILDRTLAEVYAEEVRSDRLKTLFDNNEQNLEELNETLRIRVGDMGELFGIVRQVSSDTKVTVENSLITAQLGDQRGKIADRLAQATALPSIADLRHLQALLLEEMIESGKIVRFQSDVGDATGITISEQVVRVGVFNAISTNGYLKHNVVDGSLSTLPRQPARRYTKSATNFFAADSGNVSLAIDPSRGALLSLVIQAPGLIEEISFGGGVGYTILAIGALGFALGLFRLFSLQAVGRRVSAQLKTSEITTNNPLGRVLAVYSANSATATDTLELKLDEAIIRETPRLERSQGIIKVIAAVAPLMGLLGTVVGMIKTFQTITLFGTGDPKLMADGISQALVTTVEGLVVAIPMVFLYSLVSGKSKEIIEILEEQSAGVIARQSEKLA
jgi:biopolymer transport protein ExbB